MHEQIPFKIVGRWYDTYIYSDNSIELGQNGDFDCGYNQIQNSCATLLASLMKGEAGYSFANFLAIGSGDPSWDTTSPTKSYDQTKLTTEYFRKSISPIDIIYLDPTTGLVSGSATTKIQFTVVILPGEANGTMREFGLFGGTATSVTDSGEMVNWIDHAKIDKDISLEIQRKITIEFQTQ